MQQASSYPSGPGDPSGLGGCARGHTNLLFRTRLTDMEAAYKVFRRDILADIRLRCVGFDFEPELTAALALAGRGIVEVPIGYNPRRGDEGKKIRWIDGVDAVYVLLKRRLNGRR